MDEMYRMRAERLMRDHLRKQGCTCDPKLEIVDKLGSVQVEIADHAEDCAMRGAATVPLPDNPELRMLSGKRDWFSLWEKIGDTEEERFATLFKGHPRPLSAAIHVLEVFALAQILSSEAAGWLTTRAVGQRAGMDDATASAHLHESFQADTPWVIGREDANGTWEWLWNGGSVEPIDLPGELDLLDPNGRRTGAKLLLDKTGVDIPLEEIAPSVAIMQQITASLEMEEAFLGIIRKPSPTWATARGFAWYYEHVRERVRLFRNLRGRSDQLTLLNCHCGHSMQAAHVLVMGADQVRALPPLEGNEATEWIRSTQLPFDPFFLDFTGQEQLLELDSPIAVGAKVSLIGALLNTDGPPIGDRSEVLFVTPVFMYKSHPTGSPLDPLNDGPIVVGTCAINLTDDRHHRFHWIAGVTASFDSGFGLTMLADTGVLDEMVQAEYIDLIESASERALACLHLLEASNVTLVERTLERRDAKRAEKRDWKIPLVVRVERPARRARGDAVVTNGTPLKVDWSHQWEVVGHYMHFTKGPLVWCTVCQGRQLKEGPTCPRCHGTGLDPDKVKACAKRDVVTGELIHEHGCRRVWCPPHWKGPEDKPLIPKARRLT